MFAHQDGLHDDGEAVPPESGEQSSGSDGAAEVRRDDPFGGTCHIPSFGVQRNAQV